MGYVQGHFGVIQCTFFKVAQCVASIITPMVYTVVKQSIKVHGPSSCLSFQIVYFTATFPYILIVTLLIHALMLPGSHLGVKFFIQPKWELLADPKVTQWHGMASMVLHISRIK